MKKNLKLIGISFLCGIVAAGIAAVIQVLIRKDQIIIDTKFISNCMFFSTLFYVLCMIFVVLEKNDVISNLRYIRMKKKAKRDGTEPPYRSLEEYHKSVPRSRFPAFVIWLPMLVFFVLTVLWM